MLLCLLIVLAGCSDDQTTGGSTTIATLPPHQSNLVLGQVDFIKNAANLVDAAGVFSPGGIAVDKSVSPNRLYIADTQNNRVLGYNDVTTLINGGPADIVIGQTDLNSSFCNQGGTVGANTLCVPGAVAVDSSGRLYVADTQNNRVLVYTGPISTGMNATAVLGQTDFSTNTNNSGGLGPRSLDVPTGVAADSSGNLYVADTGNNRVLEYNGPITTNAAAARVFGQPDFSSNGINTGGVSNISLNIPLGVAVDSSGNLYVADNGNNRVLGYNTPLTDTVADIVIGKANFITTACGTTNTTLCSPSSVAFDASGNLYVADTSNNRVLEYNAPLATNMAASTVFGQGASIFTTNTCNKTALNASALCLPGGVALDSSGNLYVADTSNSRVLQYVTPLADIVADIVLGQLAFTTNGTNFVDAAGLNAPKAMAVYRSVSPNRLYVADTQNNRVLGYSDVSLLATGGPADIVIGQPDLNSNRCNQGATASATTLCAPRGIAVDSLGNLYVADTNNSRVLEYDAPLATGMAATKVFGQANFTTSSCALTTTNATLCLPFGVTVDSLGNLYVADTTDHRALRYAAPLTTPGMAAAEVFGQANFANKTCNDTAAAIGGLSANSLCFPQGLAVDSADNLYVADTGNNRVLEYNSPTTDTTADTVIGQPGFNSKGANTTASSLSSPAGVALDSADNLYVADTTNSRVLEFVAPLTTNTVADDVFGQSGFTAGSCNSQATGGLSDSSLCNPEGVGLDNSGNIYVGDTINNRVLRFVP